MSRAVHPAKMQASRSAHPATIAQAKPVFATTSGALRPPHLATVAQLRPPHPAVIQAAAAYTRDGVVNAYRSLGLANRRIPASMKAAMIVNQLGLGGLGDAVKQEINAIVRELDEGSKFSSGTAKTGAKFAASASKDDEVNTLATAIALGQQGKKHGKNREALATQLHASLGHVLRRVVQIEPWAVNNCAEVAVVNKWLEACGAGVLDKIKVSSFFKGGKAKPPCKNCSQWLEITQGGYRVKPDLVRAAAAAAAVPAAAAAVPAAAAAVPVAAAAAPAPVRAEHVSIAAIPLPRGGVPGFAEFRRRVMGDEED